MISRIALTFEAGGDSVVAAQMLGVLRETGARATIFLDGAWANMHRDLIRQMVADGHELGNHTYSHPDLTELSDEEIREELHRTDTLALDVTGKRAFPWFRPPYGALDERVRRLAAREGYRVVQRNAVDGVHWPGETTVETIIQRTTEQTTDGAVLAYHLSSQKTLRALPDIVCQLRERGYMLVTLSDLLDVREHPPRHPDFAKFVIEPGYLQVMERGARVWSMNLLEFGADSQTPSDKLIGIAEWSGCQVCLLTGTSEGQQRALTSDSYVLILAGEVELQLRTVDSEAPTARAVARSGDMVLCPADHDLQWRPLRDGRRWIALILAQAGEADSAALQAQNSN